MCPLNTVKGSEQRKHPFGALSRANNGFTEWFTLVPAGVISHPLKTSNAPLGPTIKQTVPQLTPSHPVIG